MAESLVNETTGEVMSIADYIAAQTDTLRAIVREIKLHSKQKGKSRKGRRVQTSAQDK